MRSLWPDVRAVAKLAIPVALGELGWMAMTTVDTIMVGRLGPAAIGAIGIGSSAFYTFAIFGIGLLLGLDTLVSQSFGAGNREDCHHSLTQAVYVALALTAPLMLLFALMPPLFAVLGIVPEVGVPAGAFLRTLSWSTLPLLLYGAFRRYLQGMRHVQPVMFALLSANLINWFCNWLLIEGHWGLPALGVVGSALSTCLARVYMAAVLAFFIWWFERGWKPGFSNLWRAPDFTRIKRLLELGFPAATQILLEIAAFGAAAFMAGKLSAVDLAAHQIALNVAALSFMVPLGISSAAAVSVGHAIGASQPEWARRNGFIAIGLACAFMSLSAIAFLAIPRPILHLYTHDRTVLATGVGLLAIAALFQLFDGMQTVATGALRGMGNTRQAMLVNFVGYWAFGLPIGYLLCFQARWGVYGLWWGLTLSLVVIALWLLASWQRHSKRIQLTRQIEPVNAIEG